jgi:hypothetical protein
MSIRVITQNNIRVLRKNSVKRKSSWNKPKENFVLINVDASFVPENFTGGIEDVIRDATGRFIAACSDPIHYAADAHTLETRAVSRGTAPRMKLGALLSLNPIACRLLKHCSPGDVLLQPRRLCSKIFMFKLLLFLSVNLVFCNREANGVVDRLSREKGSLPTVWVDEPPEFIVALLIDDVTIT